MVKIIKRDRTIVEYDRNKVIFVIEAAMSEGKTGIDSAVSESIEETIFDTLSELDDTIVTVDTVQDLIAENLMKEGRFNTATRFMAYRIRRNEERKLGLDTSYNLLSSDFISKYKHLKNPMKKLGQLVYYRTYSRWLPDKQRREYWWETVARAVDYNCSLANTTVEEAEALFDNIFNLRQFLSGRTFWVGGTEVANLYPMANYNCSFKVIDTYDAFKDIFYLLMIGSGAGVRILHDDVNKLPKIRTNINVVNLEYNPVAKDDREDSTSLVFEDDQVEIYIGDSKEGWVQALDFFLKIHYANEYRNVNHVIMNYNYVRPQGEKLETFGGTASGPNALLGMFTKIDKILTSLFPYSEKGKVKLRPIHCLDIANLIGEGVVVGGVRRTAEVVLMDADDIESIEAKSGLYKQVNGQWEVDQDIIHRQMSNNSIFYNEKPSRERLHWQIERMRYSGEPRNNWAS